MPTLKQREVRALEEIMEVLGAIERDLHRILHAMVHGHEESPESFDKNHPDT